MYQKFGSTPRKKKEGYISDKDGPGQNCESSRWTETPSAFQQKQIRAVKEKVKKAKKDGPKRSMKTTFAEYAFDHQPELNHLLTRTMWLWDPGWTYDIALRTCSACGQGDLFETQTVHVAHNGAKAQSRGLQTSRDYDEKRFKYQGLLQHRREAMTEMTRSWRLLLPQRQPRCAAVGYDTSPAFHKHWIIKASQTQQKRSPDFGQH